MLGDNRIYTLKDVREVYRFLSIRSLQTWVKRGVIIPVQPASGRGSIVGFEYLNLIEIGLVMQLVNFGFDRYRLLKRIMGAAHSGKIPWMGNKLGFDGLFTINEDDLFSPRTHEWPDRELFGFQPRDVAREYIMANLNSHNTTGLIIVDVFAIKEHVDKMIRNYLIQKGK